MSKERRKIEDFPQEARPLLQAYHEVFGLHNTNNVVRIARGGHNPTIIVQCFGRVPVWRLRLLEERANCLVEIEGRTANYLFILVIGYEPRKVGAQPAYNPDPEVSFLYNEYP